MKKLLILPFLLAAATSAWGAPRNFPKNLHLRSHLEDFTPFAAANDYVLDTVEDASGNIFMVGATDGSWSGYTNKGGLDAYVVMFNSAGVVQWTYQNGTTGDDSAYAVTADTLGNIYVGGYTTGSLPTFSNAGGKDMFLLKFNSAGTLVWFQQFGTSGDDILYALSSDSTNNPILAGSTTGAFTGSNLGGLDIVAQKRSATDGSVTWTRQMGTSGDEEAFASGIDSRDRFYIGGWTNGSFSGYSNAGGDDVMVARINTNSNVAWFRQYGTTGDEYIFSLPCRSTGLCFGGGSTTGAFTGSNLGGEDAFFLRHNAGGTFGYFEQFGTDGNDAIRGGRVDSNNRPNWVGTTSGSLVGYTIQGATDIFFARYSNAGVQQKLTQFGSPKTDNVACTGPQASTGLTIGVASNHNWPGYSILKGYDGYLMDVSATGNESVLQQVGSSN